MVAQSSGAGAWRGGGGAMSTLYSLLSPGYEPDDGSVDGAQLVDGQWWHPLFGCDSLQCVVDNARQALAPEVAIPADQYRGGPVLWYRFPIEGPPYSGIPCQPGWRPDYYTHFTPLPPTPVQP